MRADPATVRPAPAGPRALAGTVLAAAVLLGTLAGWASGPASPGLLAATAARLVAGPAPQAPQPDDSWRVAARPDGVLARSRDRLVAAPQLPNDRGLVRAGWALLLLVAATGPAGAVRGRRRDALVGLSPSRGPPER